MKGMQHSPACCHHHRPCPQRAHHLHTQAKLIGQDQCLLQRQRACKRRSSWDFSSVSCNSEQHDHASSGNNGSASPPPAATRIANTLAGLDALLGTEGEKEKEDAGGSRAGSSVPQSNAEQQPQEAFQEGKEEKQQQTAAGSTPDQQLSLSDQIVKIVERARQLGEDPSKGAGTYDWGQVNEQLKDPMLRSEMEGLVNILVPSAGTVSKDDIKLLKEKVFGPSTFWITETKPTDDILEGGVVVRGNLRAPREEVLEQAVEGVKKVFDGRFEVFMTADPETDEEDTRGGPRVAFLIMPAIFARPKPTPKWQYIFAAVLVALTLGSGLQLGLLANIARLPKETIAWLLQPENYDPQVLPPGLANFDPTPLVMSAVPVTAAVIATQASHELGHRVVAWLRKVELGPSFFIPNNQIGSFGAITQFKCLLRNNRDMFDISGAGIFSAAAVSIALFTVGLAWSTGADVPRSDLVPVPSQLFQGSLLLGKVASTVLGTETVRGSTQVLVHPLLIGGWCGLVSTALNCLPVGRVDGGRMVQATFGQKALSITSFFTYVGLGLGFLGSNLALPFGLFVLLCQRDPENNVQDQVSLAESRRGLVIAAAIVSALILLPNAPAVLDSMNSTGIDTGTFL